MNSLTTSAGGMSTWLMMFTRLPDDAGVFRDQNAGRFREREERGVGLWRRKILTQHLLNLGRIGEAQFKEKADDVVAGRNERLIGNDGHAGGARIFSRADHLHDVALRRDERVAVQEQIDLDDLDRFLARNGLAMKMFTFPWTKLSTTSFFPVSVS